MSPGPLANILKSKNLKAIHNIYDFLDRIVTVGKYPEIKELESNSQLWLRLKVSGLSWQIS